MNPNITIALELIQQLPEWNALPLTFSGYTDDNTYRFATKSEFLEGLYREKVRHILDMIPGIDYDYWDESEWSDEDMELYPAYALTISKRT